MDEIRPDLMTDAELKEAIARYRWYHNIEVRPGVSTVSAYPAVFQRIWAFINQRLDQVVLFEKEVLDIGCLDGLFLFRAEREGAKKAEGIDSCVSRGAVELLIPAFRSQATIREESLYNLDPRVNYDVVFLFGVLYHLRYPFTGLRTVLKTVRSGGLLLIETAVLVGHGSLPLLYCPFTNSPYEKTSVTFFNEAGLHEALASMNCTVEEYVESDIDTPLPQMELALTAETAETAELRARQRAYDYWRKHRFPWILNPRAWQLRWHRNQQRKIVAARKAEIRSSDGVTVRRAWFKCRKQGEMSAELINYWDAPPSNSSHQTE